MIDPVIVTIRIGSIQLPIRWYGVIIITAIIVATWAAIREIKRRGEDSEFIWDSMIWVLIAGIVGARLWYVVNDILGGGSRFLQDPIRIVIIPEGGLHIYGAILLGGLAGYLYARRHNIDMWLILDSVAPSLLIGQAIARPANFINQELYGPPTTLPWGIQIDCNRRFGDFLCPPNGTLGPDVQFRLRRGGRLRLPRLLFFLTLAQCFRPFARQPGLLGLAAASLLLGEPLGLQAVGESLEQRGRRGETIGRGPRQAGFEGRVDGRRL